MSIADIAQSMALACSSLSNLSGSLADFVQVQSSDDTIAILISFLYELSPISGAF